MAKVSIIIPVYNEAETILTLVDKIRGVDFAQDDKEVIIVDGNSDDGTKELLSTLTEPWVRVIHEGERRGKGAAVKEGIDQAGGDCVIIQDADLEYDPSDIPSLVRPILSGEAQVVYGSRFKGSPRNMTFPRLVANKLLTFSMNRIHSGHLTDACTCYKALSTRLARDLSLESNTFDICHEITSKVLRRDIPIMELPIKYKARRYEDGVKSGWTNFFTALGTALKYRFQR